MTSKQFVPHKIVSSVSEIQLCDTLRELYGKLRLSEYGKVYGYAGIGGCDTPWDREIFTRCSNMFLPSNVHLNLGSDTICALNAAIGPTADGLLIIVGTGSIACLRMGKQRIRVGGWGYLIGDEGSGYDMGKSAINAALRAFDGRGPQTILVDLIEKESGLPISEITKKVYSSGRTAIASYASVLINAAKDKDIVATQILERCVEELILHVKAAMKYAKSENLPVVFSGGLVTNDTFIWNMIEKRLKDVHLIRQVYPPVYGSILEAIGEATPAFEKNFKADYEKKLKEGDIQNA